MQREKTDKPGTSIGDLISKPTSKLRELVEAELDYVAGGEIYNDGSFESHSDSVSTLVTDDPSYTPYRYY